MRNLYIEVYSPLATAGVELLDWINDFTPTIPVLTIDLANRSTTTIYELVNGIPKYIVVLPYPVSRDLLRQAINKTLAGDFDNRPPGTTAAYTGGSIGDGGVWGFVDVPQWLADFVNGLFGGLFAKIPWWAWACAAAFFGYKFLNSKKVMCKIIAGSGVAFTGFQAFKKYKSNKLL